MKKTNEVNMSVTNEVAAPVETNEATVEAVQTTPEAPEAETSEVVVNEASEAETISMILSRFTFQAMHKILVKAHNESNKKGISEKDCKDFGLDKAVFEDWVEKVDELKATVDAYVQATFGETLNTKRGAITRLRNAITETYTELLAVDKAEASEAESDIDILPRSTDIDYLIGWDATFLKTSNGTVPVTLAKQSFRAQVERLIGIRIAKNEMLSDEDRDTLRAYNSTNSTIDSYESALASLAKEVETLEGLLASATNEPTFTAYINQQIEAKNEEISQTSASLLKAQDTRHELAPLAKTVLERIKRA